MGYQTQPPLRDAVVALAVKQHGRVARRQLLAIGLSAQAIKRWIAKGDLVPEFRGVYVFGRPGHDRFGRWMAAVLSCGPSAALYCLSAAALWRIVKKEPRQIEIVVPGTGGRHKPDGLDIRRSEVLQPGHVTRQRGIPVTTPLETLMALAARLPGRPLEAAINEADALGLVKTPTLHEALDHHKGRPGVPLLREILDPATFVVTDSELERLFLPIARKAGLPKPETQHQLGTARVDFFFTDLDLVVEADSLRYHRTEIQQTNDLLRDHDHFEAERRWLRFTHHQIAHEPAYVDKLLRRAAGYTRGR
jgi:very-short-patch-repair endonuclease